MTIYQYGLGILGINCMLECIRYVPAISHQFIDYAHSLHPGIFLQHKSEIPGHMMLDKKKMSTKPFMS